MSSAGDPQLSDHATDLPAYWKTHGYPAFSRHLANGHEFLVLRRFGEENVLVLLHLQNKIRLLSKQLKEIDGYCSQDPNPEFQRKDRLTSIAEDANPYALARHIVLDQLQPLLSSYNTQLLDYAQVRKLVPAHRDHLDSLRNWHHNHRYAIDEAERYDLDHDYDLVCVTHQPRIALVKLLESSSFFRWLFRKKARPGRQLDSETQAWSHKKMHAFSDGLTTIFGLGMLIGPIWWLNVVNDSTYQIAITTGFILAFAIALLTLGNARPIEVLAASAAYSAVLMTFQNNAGST